MFERMIGTKLYEQVVSQICRLILDGTLKKGDRLPSESQMCEQFGVSRTTVREALRILSEQGIVQTVKGKGTVVSADQADDHSTLNEHFHDVVTDLHTHFDSCFELQTMLEPETAYRAAIQATPAEVEDLDATLTEAERKMKLGEPCGDDFRRFHRKLAEIIRNPLLLSIYDQIAQVSLTFEKVDFSNASPDHDMIWQSYVEHRKILEAIQFRNARLAYFAMSEHLQHSTRQKRNVFN